ncbi:MAG: Rossmann fold domain-containing protein [Croceibacterium sp.]
MAQAALRLVALPPAPLDAALAFHAEYLAAARALFGKHDAVVLVFAPAGHEHRAWRLAAVQELAREASPCRVNAVAGSDEDALAETLAYLEAAPGVTGQLLAVDGKPDQIG